MSCSGAEKWTPHVKHMSGLKVMVWFIVSLLACVSRGSVAVELVLGVLRRLFELLFVELGADHPVGRPIDNAPEMVLGVVAERADLDVQLGVFPRQLFGPFPIPR